MPSEEADEFPNGWPLYGLVELRGIEPLTC